MDSDEELRSILSRSKVGIWTLIETAIKVAGAEHGDELVRRRDRIVESLYAPTTCCRCLGKLSVDEDCADDNCNRSKGKERDEEAENDDLRKKNNRNIIGRKPDEDSSKSPLTPESNHRDSSIGRDDELDPFGGLFDEEQTTILSIKEQLEDPDQSEDSLVELLQSLADMEITFQALKETDIGRPVNRLRKHPSNEVRRLVKQLVRKWKEKVDEWVKVNQPHESSDLIVDEDSPQQSIPKNQHNGHHQFSDFRDSPNPRCESTNQIISKSFHVWEEQQRFSSILDERKRKRMLSNRESARRSRMRKKKLADDLMGRAMNLTAENRLILAKIDYAVRACLDVESDNSILRAQLSELKQRLEALSDIVDFSMRSTSACNSNTVSDASFSFDCYKESDDFLKGPSWDLMMYDGGGGNDYSHQQSSLAMAASSDALFMC